VYIVAETGGKMKYLIAMSALFSLVVLSCASHSGSFPDSDARTTIGNAIPSDSTSTVAPKSILDRYTLEFKIPNPLAEPGSVMNRRADPSHEGLIYCRATLLDSLATEADIAFISAKDSLSGEGYDRFRKIYLEEKVHPGQFRIRIAMESGFSPKSLDPKHWVMYLKNPQGVMIEPVQIQFTPGSSKQDSLYSSYQRASLPRTRIYGYITLYFNRVTFFKEDLLGKASPYLLLEIAQNQKTVARALWKNGKK
jgi:hypothetical protein